MSFATIKLRRRAEGYGDRLRAYRVLIDGEQVGMIRRGEQQSFRVAPGPHEVMLKIDWCRSNPMDVFPEEGETVELFCRPNANPLTVVYFITLGRARYIALEAEPAS